MKTFKKVLAVLLAVMMMMPATAAFAAKPDRSPNAVRLKDQDVKIKKSTYNGERAKLRIYIDGKKLVEGKDFVLAEGEKMAKKPGKHTVKILGAGHFKGKYTVEYTIKKADQVLSVKADPTKVKVTKKKGAKVQLTTTSKTKVSYKTNNSKIVVDENGKVKLKKGLKRGTYKITVTAKDSKYYNGTHKTIRIKVR